MLGRWNFPLTAALLVCAAALLSPGAAWGQSPSEPRYFPDPDIGVDSLPARKKAQQETASQFKVFYQFQFSDKVKESGITFVHRIVDDAARYYKGVHYDHGNGIAVADADSDGLYDIYLVNQVGPNELWKNLGGGKFRNITEAAGVGLPGRISVTASFADTDNDGDPDLFVTTVRGGNVLFRNDHRGRFTDITEEAGVGLVAHSSGAVFFDFDNDGLLDLFVCNIGRYTSEEKGPQGHYIGLADAFEGHMYPERAEFSVLYKNLGGNKFKDVSAEVGLRDASWCGDAGFADLNGDGYPDLYVLNMQGADHYYENVGGKKFVDKTAEYFPRTPWGAMGIKFFDFDNDGRLDLYLTDMHSDMFEGVGPDREKLKSRVEETEEYLGGSHEKFIFGNALFRNLGEGKFEEVSDARGVENYWPWGPSIGDLNADGWDDIFIASGMSFPFRYGINSVLLNNAGEKFLDAEFLLGVEPRREGRTRTLWYEIDCSLTGLDELNREVCRSWLGPTKVMATLSTRSAAIFDLDDDGDLDIVTAEFNSEPQVLVSDLAQRKKIHWLKVVLAGTESNRDGLGATVRVHAGKQVYTKVHDGKSGHLSQSSLPIYFGLGDAKKIDRVEVAWPSGRKQVVTKGLGMNKTLRITEPK
ncbi:MAG: CRTAC1 family protein [Candidatus Acidiferrales bacterium]